MRYQTYGTPGSRELVVGYYDVPHDFNGPRVTWEIVLREGGDIEIHCVDCPSDGSIHTMGIENALGLDGLTIIRTGMSLDARAYLLYVRKPLDCESAIASPSILGPANGPFVAVSIEGVGDPEDEESSIRIDSIHQDEPLLGGRTRRTPIPVELAPRRRCSEPKGAAAETAASTTLALRPRIANTVMLYGPAATDPSAKPPREPVPTCGMGFEITAVLLPLLWARQRRRRRA